MKGMSVEDCGWMMCRTACLLVSVVFCGYQQVYDILNMSCLGVMLHVRGRDGMSTPHNGAAAYSQSHVSHICQGGFPCFPCSFRLLECPSPMVGPP